MLQEEQQMERILKKAYKTNRVESKGMEALNVPLDTFTEHYDIYKVNWTKLLFLWGGSKESRRPSWMCCSPVFYKILHLSGASFMTTLMKLPPGTWLKSGCPFSGSWFLGGTPFHLELKALDLMRCWSYFRIKTSPITSHTWRPPSVFICCKWQTPAQETPARETPTSHHRKLDLLWFQPLGHEITHPISWNSQQHEERMEHRSPLFLSKWHIACLLVFLVAVTVDIAKLISVLLRDGTERLTTLNMGL